LRSGASAQGGGGRCDRGGNGSRQAKPADQHRDQGRVPGDEDGDQGDIHQRPVGQPLNVEQPVSAQCNGEAHNERQSGQADPTRRQQLGARDQLRQVPPGEAQNSRHDRATSDPSQPISDQRIAAAPICHDAEHPDRYQRRHYQHGRAGVHEIEPMQAIDREQRRDTHPGKHQHGGSRIGQGEHGSPGPESTIVSR